MTGAEPVVTESLIRYHLFRPWVDGGPKRPEGDPCGDCGADKSEHPMPVVRAVPSDELARRILAMENALSGGHDRTESSGLGPDTLSHSENE